MVILSHHGAQYRTKLMVQEHAEQFAACLRANPLFDGVLVYQNPRAKSERNCYVVYHPSNPDAREALLKREENRRGSKANIEGQDYLFLRDEETGRYYWCLSTSGQVYEVTRFDCTCPDHQHRCKQAGIRCKHQIALEQAEEKGGIQTF